MRNPTEMARNIRFPIGRREQTQPMSKVGIKNRDLVVAGITAGTILGFEYGPRIWNNNRIRGLVDKSGQFIGAQVKIFADKFNQARQANDRTWTEQMTSGQPTSAQTSQKSESLVGTR